MTILKPMLAAKLNSPSELIFPCLATPKLDGLRAFKRDGILYARSLKPIRNKHIVDCLADLPDGLDGELMADGDFGDASGSIRAATGTPNFKWWVFDIYDTGVTYSKRAWHLEQVRPALAAHPYVQLVFPCLLNNLEDFAEYFENAVNMGYEGVCTRTPDSPYLFRRSTPKEQYLVKHKPWEDSEFRIEDFQEAMENTNELTRDELGRAQRKGSRENHIPKGTLGSLIGTDIHTGVPVKAGTGKGLTHELRQHIWDNREAYVGRIVTYKYMKLGTREKPRMPQFVRFRDAEDMS